MLRRYRHPHEKMLEGDLPNAARLHSARHVCKGATGPKISTLLKMLEPQV